MICIVLGLSFILAECINRRINFIKTRDLTYGVH